MFRRWSTRQCSANPEIGLARLGQRLEVSGQVPARVSGVDDAARLNQQDGSLLVGARAVLGAARDDIELASPDRYVPAAQADGKRALDDEEELVGIGMRVPGEVAEQFHDLDVVVVEFSDLLRRPVLAEAR